MTKQQEFFEITSVSRADLTQAGFHAEKIDDKTMRKLAEKMADAYCGQGFWSDLEISAEGLEIRMKDE
jgi:hypothetical protein